MSLNELINKLVDLRAQWGGDVAVKLQQEPKQNSGTPVASARIHNPRRDNSPRYVLIERV